eukprot:TRINITY_DN116107_c0_g1_i1.p1 TRINITY_DN116107_c0_g1~~TRINITY_DN116107_c0_g1_i1.p1  ORF type:complete len:277 (+),score=50.12 TRINITY_DN116107_c0_g1_i1:31-861(+)
MPGKTGKPTKAAATDQQQRQTTMHRAPQDPPDSYKVAEAWKEQSAKEHHLFRSFVRRSGQGQTQTQSSFRASAFGSAGQAQSQSSFGASAFGSTGHQADAFLHRPANRPTLGSFRSTGSIGFGLKKGEHVRIGDMGSRKELNGHHGIVVDHHPDEHGRVFVEIDPSQKGGKTKVMRVLASRLSYEDPGEEERVPEWMPKGVHLGDPLGASLWSASGVRTGFIGHGLIHKKSLSQSSLYVPPPSSERRGEIEALGHRAFTRNQGGRFLPKAREDLLD